jgi:hypothetical protein
MAGREPTTIDWNQQFRGAATTFFEAQLKALGLSQEHIKQQSVPELEDSLERVNDALKNPESFGMLRLKTSSSGFVVTSPIEAHIEIGALPLLLERKKLITERLRLLRSEKKVNNLRDLIDTVAEKEIRQQLLTEFEALKQKVSTSEKEKEISKNYAFIAMAMDTNNPELEDVLEAIKDGAERCNIKAERIDEVQTNERITDRTLESISKAEFVVVDLTYARPNVYYEAGYAQGAGKTPVYVAKAGTELHFDVKDYPVIFYPNMRGLKQSLAERLRAVSSGRK